MTAGRKEESMFHRRRKRRTHVRVGLRTLKTALAVGLALYIVSLFGEISIFPALAAPRSTR